MLFRLGGTSPRLQSVLIDCVVFIYGTQLLQLSEVFSEDWAQFIITQRPCLLSAWLSASSATAEPSVLDSHRQPDRLTVPWTVSTTYAWNAHYQSAQTIFYCHQSKMTNIYFMLTSVKFHRWGDTLLAERHRLRLRRVYLLLWGRAGIGHDDCWWSITDTADGV